MIFKIPFTKFKKKLQLIKNQIYQKNLKHKI